MSISKGTALLLVILLGCFAGWLVVSDPYLIYSLIDRDDRAMLYLTYLPFPMLFSFLLPPALLVLGLLVYNFVGICHWILDRADIVLCCGFFLAHQLNSFSVGPVDPTDLMAAFGTILILFQLFTHRRVPVCYSPQFGLYLVILLFLTGSLFFFPGAYSLIRAYKSFFLLILFVWFALQRDVVPMIVKMILIVLPISATFCIIQEIVWLTTGVLLIGPGIEKSKLETMFEFGLFRVCGLTNFYTVWALAAGCYLFITYALTIFPNKIVRGPLKKVLCLISMTIAVIAIIFTTAKDVWIATFTGFCLLTTVRYWRFLPFAIPSVCLLFGAILWFYSAMLPGKEHWADLLLKEVKLTEAERITLDRRGMEAVVGGNLSQMMFGRGPGQAHLVTMHTREWPPHNAFVMIGVEGGIFCTITLIFFYLIALYRCLQIIFLAPDQTTFALGMGLLGGWGVIFFYSNFQTTYLDPFIVSYFALMEVTAIKMLTGGVEFTPENDTFMPEFAQFSPLPRHA